MPDLQTELNKVITSWDTPEPAPAKTRHLFQPTTGVSRATFDYIKAHPGLSRAQITRDLMDHGHKKASVSSLVVQMIRQGTLREVNGGVFTARAEYTPIKPRLVRAAQAALPTKRKYTRKAKPEVKPVVAAPVAVAPAPAVPAEFDADEFVNGLTLKQAKAVYLKLQEFFGGGK